MKISIAVPSYNYGRFLEACLESIYAQDYQNYEVLIADGGSNDDSLNIINRLCSKDKRFQLISTNDQGQADAVATALAQATGDIFCFINADDCYLCHDALAQVAAAFHDYHQADIVSFGGYYIDPQGNYIKPVSLRYHPLDSIALMKYRTAVLQPATFWRRRVQEAVPFRTDFHYAFDAFFFYEAYCRFSWLELSKPVAGYRLHAFNKSRQIIPERIYELAKFEQLKFGSPSFRAFYLRLVGLKIGILRKIPVVGGFLCRCVYKIVNSLAFITCYRLPSI
jgi:glycosyltransferase involved in cell wall biosynthesis